MPSVVINEKDYSVFNIYSNNDNIVWIPGFAITGPYDEPVLLNSPLDLINTFGDVAPATQYATGATNATYKLASGYEFASQMLNKGFRVLFQRIAPYTLAEPYDAVSGTYAVGDVTYYQNDYYMCSEATSGTFAPASWVKYTDIQNVPGVDLIVDDTKLKSASVTISDTNFKPTADTVKQFKIVARDSGTYGNRLNVTFTMNVNQNKLYLKVIDTTTDTVLEYKEICNAKFKTGTNTIDPTYIFNFAKGFVGTIDSSEYIALESGNGYLSDVTSINNYIIDHIKVGSEVIGSTNPDSVLKQGENGTLVYTGATPFSANADFQSVTSATANTVNLFDAVVVNPISDLPAETTVTNIRSTFNISKGIVKGSGTKLTEMVTVWDSTLSTPAPKVKDITVVTDVVVGKDFTINEAIVDDYINILADTIAEKLAIVSDTILYDVKFITLGGISVPKDLKTTIGYGKDSIYSIVAGFCATRGDCVAILEPNYGEEAKEVQATFKASESGIGGTSASYASAFAPWGAYNLYNGTTAWASPSLVFLSALADSVSKGNPVYLPPAGVNRASLPDLVTTEYKIGSTILNMWQNKDRPDNINPIMSLNNYGYVIFGQRTLYDVSDTVVGMRSALQELGVRLSVIELKKRIKQVATGLLFEYNNIHTWNEFKAGMYPMLNTMVGNGAVQAYQIIMNGISTSPDDIDNNVIRGTIKIVPGRAVEDFIITFELYRSGVTFTNDREE